MNFVSAIVCVIVIGWAAAHPNGDQFSIPPITTDPANCIVTSQSDGPVDPAFEAKLKAATEQLCKTLDEHHT